MSTTMTTTTSTTSTTTAEEREALIDAVREFSDAHLAPFAAERDAEKIFPLDALRAAGEIGLGGIYVGEQYGSGLSRVDAVSIFEQLSKGDIAVAAYISIHNMVAWMIDAFGDDEQRAEWLPELASMRDLASYCLTEPGAGSDAAAITTSARVDGEHYVLNGTKQFISGWEKTLASVEIQTIVTNSLLIAAVVTVGSVILAFFGALAFARYDWKGRKLFQKIILLPIFFPQPVLGLALLLWFNALGLTTSWQTAVIAHMVWITPVVTLVIAIQVYGFDPTLEEAARDLGASRWMILREVTLPVLWPGIWSGALFAFLLSWGNFPLSLFTAGVDSTIPKWLYSKMVSGYTPMVPALGTMSTMAAAVLLLGGGLVVKLMRRRNAQA